MKKTSSKFLNGESILIIFHSHNIYVTIILYYRKTKVLNKDRMIDGRTVRLTDVPKSIPPTLDVQTHDRTDQKGPFKMKAENNSYFNSN